MSLDNLESYDLRKRSLATDYAEIRVAKKEMESAHGLLSANAKTRGIITGAVDTYWKDAHGDRMLMLLEELYDFYDKLTDDTDTLHRTMSSIELEIEGALNDAAEKVRKLQFGEF